MGSALSRRLLPQGVQPQYVALTRTLALFPVLLIGAEVSPGKITIKGAPKGASLTRWRERHPGKRLADPTDAAPSGTDMAQGDGDES
jgi:hypothetical protein